MAITFDTILVTTLAAAATGTNSGFFQNLGDGRGYIPMQLWIGSLPPQTAADGTFESYAFGETLPPDFTGLTGLPYAQGTTYAIVADGVEGSKAARITVGTGSSRNGRILETLPRPCTSGQRVKVSVMAKTSDSTSGYLRMDFFNSAGSSAGITSSPQYKLSSTFEQYDYYFFVPSGLTGFRTGYVYGGKSGTVEVVPSSTMTIDNISVSVAATNTVPGPMRNVSAVSVNSTTGRIYDELPFDDGGLTITGIRRERNDPNGNMGGNWSSIDPPDTTFRDFANLSPGIYTFTTSAINSQGEGPRTTRTVNINSTPVQPVSNTIFATSSEIASAPSFGPAWNYMKSVADKPRLSPIVVNSYDHEAPEQVMAAAFVYAKTGTQSYKDKVVDMCREIIGTENLHQSSGANTSQQDGDKGLATMRMLPAYVIASSIVGMDKTLTGTRTGETSRTWEDWLLNRILYRSFSDPIGTNGRWKTPLNTITSSGSNWGAQAAQTCAAISIYTGETVERAKIVKCVRGMMGDQTATGHPTYAPGTTPPNTNSNSGEGFRTTSEFDTTMVSDYSAALNGWHPINPAGGSDPRKDGVCVEDASRSSSSFDAWIAGAQDSGTGYSYEYMTGLFCAVTILNKAGYDILGVANDAPRRALDFMSRVGWHPSEFGGRWGLIPWVNYHYGTNYSMPSTIDTTRSYNSSHFWKWLYAG